MTEPPRRAAILLLFGVWLVLLYVGLYISDIRLAALGGDHVIWIAWGLLGFALLWLSYRWYSATRQQQRARAAAREAVREARAPE